MGFYEDKLYPMVIKTVEAEVKTPHLQEILNGTLPLEKFKFQIRQNYNYLMEYSKGWAIGAARCRDYEVMLVLVELLRETLEHEVPFYREYWKKTLDISPEELEMEQLSCVKRSYTSHELARGWEGSIVELVTALLPCAFVYWQMGRKMKSMCTLPEGNLFRNWIEFYTTGWYDEACKQLIELINKLTFGLTPREEARVLEIFAAGCNYEYISWDMYYNMEKWPLGSLFQAKSV